MQTEDSFPRVRTQRHLTRLERQQIAAQLWKEARMETGQPILVHGAIARCAKKFNFTGPTISNAWKQMKENFAKGILTASPVKKEPRPSSCLYCRDELRTQINALPHSKRQNLRDIANELGIGKTTLHRILKWETTEEGGRYFVPHTNSVLPYLTAEDTAARHGDDTAQQQLVKDTPIPEP